MLLFTLKMIFQSKNLKKMEKTRRVIIAVILMISIGNYFKIVGNENIRPIQFFSIFTIGMLSGLLLNEVFTYFKAQKKV
jgi:hypothetical protein